MLIKKCLRGEAPMYMQELLHIKHSKRNLRNVNTKLEVPFVYNSTFAFRAFNVFGPRLWNNLLKTFLLQRAYDYDNEFVFY